MAVKQTTYKDSGVNYEELDPFKIACLKAGLTTIQNIQRMGITEIPWTRGESCYVVGLPNGTYMGIVDEGLGTKIQVALAMQKSTKKLYYNVVSQDTLAMIVNDMITVAGMLPVSVTMHISLQSGKWLSSDPRRYQNLIDGWLHACNLAGCTWGGGETAALKGIVQTGTSVLSGSAIGFSTKIRRPCPEPGDAIIMLSSSGIHANGLTMARDIALTLEDGYLTKLPNGTTYGEALLQPTHIYVDMMERLMEYQIDIHQVINITGHGWRKLMRLPLDLVYYVTEMPPQLPIFEFIQKMGNVSNEEAYGNLNMGAGFAIVVNSDYKDAALEVIAKGNYPFTAWIAGYVEEGERSVVIEPIGLEFGSKTLQIR